LTCVRSSSCCASGWLKVRAARWLVSESRPFKSLLGQAGRGGARLGAARQGLRPRARYLLSRKIMKAITFSIEGESPLIMHNSRLADPLDQFAKAMKQISGKQKKTETDHEEMARIEFFGGCYYDEKIGPYIPRENIEACIIEASKKQRLGQKFKSGLMATVDRYPLDYSGPRTLDKMYESSGFRDRRSVVVARSRVMRTRPCFRAWSLTFSVVFDASQLNRGQVVKAVEEAGMIVGLGDYRPRFGRFKVVSVSD
jgi:hypothetical protein